MLSLHKAEVEHMAEFEQRKSLASRRMPSRQWISEEGSLSLEAAVVLPPLLIYIVLLFLLSLSIRADMIWQEAAWSSIQEVSLALALNQNDEYQENTSILNLKELGISHLTDLVSSESLEARQRYWFRQNTGGSELMKSLIRNPSGSVKRLPGKDALFYVYSYQVPLSPESRERSFRLPLPYWGGHQSRPLFDQQIREEEERQDSSIWSEQQLKRGQYFREAEGGNLPSNFPVVAKFEGGTAYSIKSIDLTAPSYQSDENLSKQINEHAAKLSAYQGTEAWGSQAITIKQEDIGRKVLRYVIPENSPPELLSILEREKILLASENIQMEWVMRGKSSKYLNEN